MSTCIMITGGNRHSCGESPDYCLPSKFFLADGDVTHSEFGRVGYHTEKMFFTFLRGSNIYEGQAVCFVSVGTIGAAEAFMRYLHRSACEGGKPDWSIPEVRLNYANLAVEDDYELFVNAYDIQDGLLREYFFVVGRNSRGHYTFDVSDDVGRFGGYGIGVDGAKMVLGMEATRYACGVNFDLCTCGRFFDAWACTLHETGNCQSFGAVVMGDEDDYDDFSSPTLEFRLGRNPNAPEHNKRVATIRKMRCRDGGFGRHQLFCEGLGLSGSVVSYSSSGEVNSLLEQSKVRDLGHTDHDRLKD